MLAPSQANLRQASGSKGPAHLISPPSPSSGWRRLSRSTTTASWGRTPPVLGSEPAWRWRRASSHRHRRSRCFSAPSGSASWPRGRRLGGGGWVRAAGGGHQHRFGLGRPGGRGGGRSLGPGPGCGPGSSPATPPGRCPPTGRGPGLSRSGQRCWSRRRPGGAGPQPGRGRPDRQVGFGPGGPVGVDPGQFFAPSPRQARFSRASAYRPIRHGPPDCVPACS